MINQKPPKPFKLSKYITTQAQFMLGVQSEARSWQAFYDREYEKWCISINEAYNRGFKTGVKSK